MNDGLIDSFRHNAWATRELLKSCRGLSEKQLHATATGTYGSIIKTFSHIVTSEAGYCARLTGEEPTWDRHSEDLPSFDDLERYVDELADRWERFLERPFDAERTFVVHWHDGGDRDVPAGVFLSQALHHGNEHRAHICTVMTTLGIATPHIGLWDWAEATDRAVPRSA